jgi:cob(I)alamin adenosyltransferase
MPKRTRIYTRTGDKGMTGLVGGGRIKKNAPRIEAYGALDELSSAIGLARATLQPSLCGPMQAARLDSWLSWTQDVLFNLGSELATPPEQRRDGSLSVGSADVGALERAIDDADSELPPLASFIHPGGSMPGAHLHFARTICRRAERLLITLAEGEKDDVSEPLRYLNRLSDALFVWARWINAAVGISEHQWNKSSRPPEK